MTWIEPLTDAVVALMLVIIGGNLGSFLNVVAHRLPRGTSVVHGGSRCPDCGAPIRWHDNVPVLGWLLLGGRCRDCLQPIAPRYPLVEATAAALIGGVAACELLSGGATVPNAALGPGRAGADSLLLRPDWRLIGYATFHAWLLFALLLSALVEADGRTLPRRSTLWALAVTLGAVSAWNWLQPVGIGWTGPDGALPGLPGWVPRGLLGGLAGMACGAALGGLVSPAFRAAVALVGTALGWQAVIAVGVLVPVCRFLRRLLGRLLMPRPWEATVAAGAIPRECPPGSPTEGVAEDLPPTSRRLRRAAADALGRDGTLVGDLFLATAALLPTWRWWVAWWL